MSIKTNSIMILTSPEKLLAKLSLSVTGLNKILQARHIINAIIKGKDKRLLIVVGPCSIHDPNAAREYANLLREAARHFCDDLFLVMRAYFEKPRTTLGWTGLISDPNLDESYDMNSGLEIARKLLLDLNDIGMPTATEFLDNVIPAYLEDLITWCAIGARTAESQRHRELASGLAMPVGFKNNTSGNIQIAIDAITVAMQAQHFIGINRQGNPAIIHTAGNPNCHIILRGSNSGTNYSNHHVEKTAAALKQAHLTTKIMIDCSHGNSQKNYNKQKKVVRNIAKQIENGSPIICGVMLESNIEAGNQILKNKTQLKYGQSITDGCLSWKETYSLLEKLALATHKKNYVIPVAEKLAAVTPETVGV